VSVSIPTVILHINKNGVRLNDPSALVRADMAPGGSASAVSSAAAAVAEALASRSKTQRLRRARRPLTLASHQTVGTPYGGWPVWSLRCMAYIIHINRRRLKPTFNTNLKTCV
jgi:hypothetical protein